MFAPRPNAAAQRWTPRRWYAGRRARRHTPMGGWSAREQERHVAVGAHLQVEGHGAWKALVLAGEWRRHDGEHRLADHGQRWHGGDDAQRSVHVLDGPQTPRTRLDLGSREQNR